MRLALYARVSTKQHGQDVETQLQALRAWARQRKAKIVDEYADRGWSGSKERRPELDRLMRDAKQKRFDAVIVWRFDRFARSVKHLIAALDDFRSWGVDFISLSEAIDTSTPVGKMVFTILGAVAELERQLIRERVQLGVDRARREGRSLGRPHKRVDREWICKAARQGQSVKSIARQANIAWATARTIISGCLNNAKHRGSQRGPKPRR
jgi:DNA invertase Pin-like site-specific DNA recombinase